MGVVIFYAVHIDVPRVFPSFSTVTCFKRLLLLVRTFYDTLTLHFFQPWCAGGVIFLNLVLADVHRADVIEVVILFSDLLPVCSGCPFY